MSSTKSTRVVVVPELAAAGVLLIIGALGAAKLALAPPTDLPMSPIAWSVLMVMSAVLLLAAGIESLRKRHFLFVVLVPVAPALVTLGYVMLTGQTAVLSQALMAAVLMVLVASRRSNFA